VKQGARMLTLPTPSTRVRPHPRFSPGLSPVTLLRYDDLIVAPATAHGPGARAILRLTGEKAWSTIRALLHPKEDIPTAIVQGRFPAQLRLPDFYSPLPVQVQAWAAPFTYTGQDLVEVHLISSPPLVQSLLDHLIDRGARLAEPGEFTLRAYLAGKLDLTQAEAVYALSTSTDPDELRTALTQLAGGLARPLDALREEILLLLAEVEAGLDFADEDLTFIENDALAWRIDACRIALQDVQDQMRRQGRSKTQYRVVLAGPPNAGKSSLFNMLLGETKAIVSAEAGTTRDYLTQNMLIQGVSLELVDTAGLQTDLLPTKTIELRAQEMQHTQVDAADLLVVCFDSTIGLTEQDTLLFRHLPQDRVLLVATKSDLHSSQPIPEHAILTSTITGAGLSTLRFTLAEKARWHLRPANLPPSLSRCQVHLERSLTSLTQALELVHEKRHMELVAAELRSALDAIGTMVGAVYTDDLLDRVFSQFCIGK
jgi:tRNA modification GTPase